MEPSVLRVSSKTTAKAMAGAIAMALRESGHCEIQAIGAGAVNQAVKGVAIARGYVSPQFREIVCVPTFRDIELDGEKRSAILLLVDAR